MRNVEALQRTLLIVIALVLMSISTTNCDAQSSCESCQGQCQYCVDGQCIPRRHTFGHYQTNWRRWPVPPPTIPVTDQGAGGDAGSIYLPLPEDEGEVDPDFAHRKQRAQGLPAVETRRDAETLEGPDEGPTEARPADPFRDDAERIPSPAEGSTSRNTPRSFPLNDAQIASARGIHGNPLRSVVPPTPRAMRVGFQQSVSRPLSANQPRYANPLR